jgi:hypothetical protein
LSYALYLITNLLTEWIISCEIQEKRRIKMSRAMKFLIGSVMGGILGATAAILLAPGSGEETRNAVKYRIEQMTDEFQSAVQQRKEELEAELRQYKQLD